MTKSQTYCDECGKPKGDETGWRPIGVMFDVQGEVRYIMIENKPSASLDERVDEIRDTCGESCFHRHIDKLLQPLATASTTIPTTTAAPTASSASDSPRD
jgi:hypothetical protein